MPSAAQLRYDPQAVLSHAEFKVLSSSDLKDLPKDANIACFYNPQVLFYARKDISSLMHQTQHEIHLVRQIPIHPVLADTLRAGQETDAESWTGRSCSQSQSNRKSVIS